MAEKDEIAWVFDALVGFLQGSFWSTSILNFIEEKSLIFEPETSDSNEYREIHKEYKNFVNLLLDCHIEDMEITPEQFERACSLIKNSRISIEFQHGLFEQIWAANEFEVFKRMMIQKNLELQLQSLKMIEQKYGLKPASLTDGINEVFSGELQMEKLLEIEKTKSSNEKSREDDVDLEVKNDKNVTPLQEEQCLATCNQKNIQETLNQLTDESLCLQDEKQETKLNAEKILAKSSDYNESKAKHSTVILGSSSITNPPPTNLINSHDEINVKPETKEDIRNRQLYLKAQRDKLVALKKKARNQKFEENSVRPNSACAIAEATIDGKQQDLIERQQAMDASILQVRKALAARLKAEVVQKSN